MRAAIRDDFRTFAAKAVPELDSHPLQMRPHIELMAGGLDQLYRGATNQLMVNAPPRLLKSRLCTVCFGAWLIGKHPGFRLLVVSHDQKLADTLVDDVRRLVRSPWYADAFPGAGESTELSRSGHFQTRSGSQVMARSMEAGVTGHGFDLIIFDDPMDAGDANSAAARENVLNLFDRKFRSRLQSQRDGKILVVAQRLHRDDLCGQLASREGWLNVILPLIANEATTHVAGEAVWHRKAGDILDPDRYPAHWIEKENRQNPSVFASQYQQAPFLTESSMLKRDWVATYQGRPPVEANKITISVDCAASQRSGASYTCMIVWATDGTDHYLVEVVRDRMLFPAMSERLIDLICRFRPGAVLIEDASVGTALIPHVKTLLPNLGVATSIKAVKPTQGKADRLRVHLDIFANGHLRVPEGRPISEAFIDELMLFEEGGFSDQVDATTQYLDYAKDRLGLAHTLIIKGVTASNPYARTPIAPRPIDRSTLRKPAHGVPSLRNPQSPRPGGFGRGR
jgi:predicted phage terminase large subunit-like protein